MFTAPTSREDLARALGLVILHGGYSQAAMATGMAETTLHRRAKRARAMGINALVDWPAAVKAEIDQVLEVWRELDQDVTATAAKIGLSRPTVQRRIEQAGMARLLTEAEIPLSAPPIVHAVQQGDSTAYDLRYPIPEGLTSRGDSVLYGPDDEIRQTWHKTKPAGREPEDAVKIPNARVARTATLFDAQGKVSQQWVTEKAEDAAREEAIKLAVTAFMEGAPPIPISDGPSKFDSDVIPWFQIGDAHIGALAHEAETGANFDLKIAERELCAAFAILFDECPPRERCVINDCGDMTHYENMLGVTEASRNMLDCDGRFPKMIGVYARTMRFIVDRALEKFSIVDVIINQGNHSRTNDIWMAELLRQAYGHTGRVNVLDNSNVFIPYRMGNTFVMCHHGDKTRPEDLARVMCQDFRQDWGECAYRYIDVGHLHHKWSSRESAGCVIEMWNTLAAKDKWHNDAGYRSQQSITRVDRSRTYGEVGRRVLPIGEIRDLITRAHGASVYVPPERRLVFSV